MKRILLLMIAGHLNIQCAIAELTTGIDPDARLPFWELKEKGIRIRLVQRLPDQTRAYFLKRGFTVKQAEVIAQSCVFQTIFYNLATAVAGKNNSLTYNLNDWKVIPQSISKNKLDKKKSTSSLKFSKLKVREDWAKIWASHSIPNAAKIAFKWSLFPTSQVYQPGDHNWGMTVYDLKPADKFTLQLSWTQGMITKTRKIKNIQCAPDIHPDPGSLK